MRVPFTKIYRAFPELAHLPDAECERIVWRVQVGRATPVWLYALAAVAGLAAWGALVWMALRRVPSLAPDLDGGSGPIALFLAVLGGGGALSASLAALLVRDLRLWLGVRRYLRRASCPKCGQSLMGLPVQQTSIGPPQPGEAWVRCTECGRRFVLMDLGLTPLDLTPWEQRGVPADFARIRREGEWVPRRWGRGRSVHE